MQLISTTLKGVGVIIRKHGVKAMLAVMKLRHSHMKFQGDMGMT